MVAATGAGCQMPIAASHRTTSRLGSALLQCYRRMSYHASLAQILFSLLLAICFTEHRFVAGQVQSTDGCIEVDGTCFSTSRLHARPPQGITELWGLLEAFSREPPSGSVVNTEKNVNFSICNVERVSLQREPQRALDLLRDRILSSSEELPLPPVILTELRSLDAQHVLNQTWGDVEWLLSNFGDLQVFAGPPVKRPVYGETTFKQYVQYMRSHPVDLGVNSTSLDFDYQFKRAQVLPPAYWKMANLELKDKRLENFLVPPELAYQQRLLGLPFHAHGPVVNEVVSGRKYWFIYPKLWGCNQTEIDEGGPQALHDFVPPRWRNTSELAGQQVGVHSCHSIMKHIAFAYVTTSQDHYLAPLVGGTRAKEKEDHYLELSKQCRQSSSCGTVNVSGKSLLARWVVDVMPSLPPKYQPTYRCSVNTGEMMVVPHYNWHATLNLDDTAIFVRGATEEVKRSTGCSSVPRCTKMFDQQKVLVQLWNLQEEDVRVFWRNTSSGEATQMAHLQFNSAKEMRTFAGLKFYLWCGNSSYGDLVGTFTAGQPVKPSMAVGGKLTDLAKWDHCNFKQRS